MNALRARSKCDVSRKRVLSSATHVVGSKLAIGGATYSNHADLVGSMREWVSDWYDETYCGTASGAVSWCGPPSFTRS